MQLRMPSTYAQSMGLSLDLCGSRPHEVAAAYLEGLTHGLVLLERGGRVAFCSAAAARLLGLGAGVAGLSLRGLLGALSRGRRHERSVALMKLRGPLARGEGCMLDVEVCGESLELEIAPLSGAGWSIAVAPSGARADRRQGGPDGGLDPLTGLPNRMRFQTRLNEARSRLQRNSEGFALLAVDLDRFKHVNDTLGHPIGDALLQKVAERLQSAVRPTDTVARFGGDEFAVIQGNVSDVVGAETLAKRIVDLLGRAYIVEGHLINIGASVGVAIAPADGDDPDVLLKNADLALYRAKTDGRDTFRFFEPEMDARMQARRSLELDLRKALAMHEFELVYQPQMNLETNQLVGCEALIRWHHPSRGLVSPVDFIPLAEEIGLIVSIGEWVIRTACTEAARWPDALSVAVNLSPAQFKSKKLVQVGRLRAVDLRLGAEPAGAGDHRRRAAPGERGQPRHAARAARARAAHLHGRFRHRLLVAELPALVSLRQDQDRPVLHLGRQGARATPWPSSGPSRASEPRFGMTTVAEGVETPEQMSRIRHEGCTDVQGYFISRPISATDIRTLFAEACRIVCLTTAVEAGAAPMSDLYRLVYTSRNLLDGGRGRAAGGRRRSAGGVEAQQRARRRHGSAAVQRRLLRPGARRARGPPSRRPSSASSATRATATSRCCSASPSPLEASRTGPWASWATRRAARPSGPRSRG